MTSDENQKLELLIASADAPDFLDTANSVLSSIEVTPGNFSAVARILRFMELNPDLNLGQPGPFVHFCEQFDEVIYEEALVQSIRRRPTRHLLWMANRIANSKDAGEFQTWKQLIFEVSEDLSIEESIRDFATFLCGPD